MSIYANFLSQGYLPKELPPAFSTEDFSDFARTKLGRAMISQYKPTHSYTDCVAYRLALPGPGGLAYRELRIPHPFAYAKLAEVVAKNFRRLLTKAGASPFSRSRPVYADDQERALRTLISPPRLARERALVRATATHLLKTDISHFYPSLYTHAVGWAVDPKLRERRNWGQVNLLGKQLDQLLMNLQGKVSQGIPIGPDISFLMAEIVLSQVDRALKLTKGSAYRWFDDFEVACTSQQDAERTLRKLAKLLDSFKLRLNLNKTMIVELPLPAGERWQDELLSMSRHSLSTPAGIVAYFDHAVRLRAEHPDSPVLMYAIGVLFRIHKPPIWVHQVAQSYMLQAVVSEPGCTQKVFALLTFWNLNGVPFDRELAVRAIVNLAALHVSRGVSSDLAWALAFAIQNNLKLPKQVGFVCSEFDDDAIAIEALHADSLGLLSGLDVSRIERALTREACEGSHWLVLYEGVRQGFLRKLSRIVRSDKFFAALLASDVTFYRTKLPDYALLIHPGGGPDWVVQAWIKGLASAGTRPAAVGLDLAKLSGSEQLSSRNAIRALLGRFSKRGVNTLEPYS